MTTSFFSAVVPGSPATVEGDPPSPATLGIEPSYSECDGCPDDFTISADGESIVWTEGAELVVFDTASGETRSWTVPALADQAFRSLDVRTSSDGGVEAAISFGWPDDTDVRAVVVATSPAGRRRRDPRRRAGSSRSGRDATVPGPSRPGHRRGSSETCSR